MRKLLDYLSITLDIVLWCVVLIMFFVWLIPFGFYLLYIAFTDRWDSIDNVDTNIEP